MTNTNEKTYAIFSAPNNKKIVSKLVKNGVKVFEFPSLETEKTLAGKEFDSVLHNLERFDWIIFPDVLAVDYFLEALEENQFDLFEMDSLRVCAFGEAVSDRLRFVQLHADVIPATVEAQTVFRHLCDYIGQDEMRDLRFLLPKDGSREYELKEKLSESGASLMELPVYRVKLSEANEILKLKILLRGGAIDQFIVSSPTDLIALEHYFDGKPLSETLGEVIVSAIDKAMLQTLEEHGLTANYVL